MKNRSMKWFGLALVGFTFLGGGCIKGIREGFNGGLDSAVSTVIETLITNALAPLVDGSSE